LRRKAFRLADGRYGVHCGGGRAPAVSPHRPLDEAIERAARALLNAALAAETDPQQGIGGNESLTALRARGLTAAQAARAFEARLVREALAAAGGNVSRAARLLGMKRTTLVARLRRAATGRGGPRPEARA
jgi:DNA-binding NtrC family response regulator